MVIQFLDELKPNLSKPISENKQETISILGKLTKIDPQKLSVGPELIAYVTNAKTPLRRREDHGHVRKTWIRNRGCLI